MLRFLENKFAVAAILTLFALALGWNVAQGGSGFSLRGRGSADPEQVLLAHGPGAPPDPWEEVRVAHGPGAPPDPWEEVRVAHGPGAPPDPWEEVRTA